MHLSFSVATERDAAAIAALRTAVAQHLTSSYGRGHWSSAATEKGALRRVRTSRVLLARHDGALVATLTLRHQEALGH